MNVFEWQASQIERAGETLAYALDKTEPGKLDWAPTSGPESKTRSALDQAAECIGANRRFAALLRGEPAPQSSDERPFADGAEAPEQVRASARELAETVRGLDDSALGRIYATARGDMPGPLVISLPAVNLWYHFGQVSFIQTFYGDTNRYFPDRK